MKKTKKQQNCSKLLMVFSMSIAMLTGVFALGIGLMKETYKSARAVSYDDEEYSITLNVDELNNYVFANLSLYASNSSAYVEYAPSNSATYGNLTNTYVAVGVTTINDVQCFYVPFGTPNPQIALVNNHFGYYTQQGGQPSDLEYDLTIVFSSTYYNDIKQAIEQDIAANQPVDDNMSGALQQFVQILVNGIGDLAKGVAQGISTMAKSLFLNVVNGEVVGLSVFGGIVAIFAGLALAVGITTKVYQWITSLGN